MDSVGLTWLLLAFLGLILAFLVKIRHCHAHNDWSHFPTSFLVAYALMSTAWIFYYGGLRVVASADPDAEGELRLAFEASSVASIAFYGLILALLAYVAVAKSLSARRRARRA